jgi:FkbM family methyltransferase
MLISLDILMAKYRLDIKNILHVGAHRAEELSLYNNLGVSNVMWIEANPELYNELKERLKDDRIHSVINAVASDKNDEEVVFKVNSNTQASSIYDLGAHKKYYPEIKPAKEIKLRTKRIDKIIEEMDSNISYDFVNLDIQGAELKALKGMGKLLSGVNYIYLEVNLISIYKKCPKLHNIDFFLAKQGFTRVELKLTNAFWGDAFYVKNLSNKKANYIKMSQAIWLEINAVIKQLRDQFYTFRKKI